MNRCRFAATFFQVLIVFTMAGVGLAESAPMGDAAGSSAVPATMVGKTFLTIPGEQWPLVWHDEFNETSLDQSKWTSGLSWAGDDGAHRHHNNLYASLIADDDVEFKDGMLALLTRKQDVVDARGRTFHYTQAFIQTAGKFEYTYGYCEIRAKVPHEAGPGLWPAFWMLSSGWPPEDDIAEFWTGRPLPHFHQGFAYRLPMSGKVMWNSRHVDEVPTGFHTYGMEWGPGYQLMNFDGKIRVRVYGAQSPSVPMYLILNSGVASNPAPTSRTVFPNAFLVNYIRVYKRPAVPSLIDGGFEDGQLAPWKAWNQAKIVSDNVHGGKGALHLNGSPASVEQRVFGLTPNTMYELSGWADSQDGSEVRLGVKDFGGSANGAEIWSADTQRGWRQISVRFTTGSHNSTATIYCYKAAGALGANFDDIRIAAVPK